jgi:hypothetical protein
MNTNTLPREVTVNAEQRLYVIPCGEGRNAGFTCLGFDVAQRWTTETLAWLADPMNCGNAVDLPKLDAAPGTIEHYNQYKAIMTAGSKYNAVTRRRCNAELIPELIGLEGKRVEVIPGGEKSRFYVGKSTGWRPCHLEIKRRDSTGGAAVYFPKGSTVRVVGGKR